MDERDGPVRVLVVDDHPMVREGLQSMLAGDDIQVVGAAGTGAEAVRAIQSATPDLVLLDVELPDLDGLAVLRRIKEIAPRTAVLIVSMHGEPSLVRRAVEAGAAGYVLKGVSRRELRSAVRAVRDGESVLDPTLLRVLARESGAPSAPATARPGDSMSESLTPIDREVLRLIADGLTNREISARMRWSVATAKKYVQRVLEKLGVSDRTQAAVTALRRGLLG